MGLDGQGFTFQVPTAPQAPVQLLVGATGLCEAGGGEREQGFWIEQIKDSTLGGVEWTGESSWGGVKGWVKQIKKVSLD